jgi:uncharacterized C2H2 Zn-finger protein
MEEQPMQDGKVCGKCGASFETQEDLDRHVQSEHGEEGTSTSTKA